MGEMDPEQALVAPRERLDPLDHDEGRHAE